MLTIRCRANRGGVSEPCSLFLWRRSRQSGPSLEHWGGVLITSDPVRHGSSRAASGRAWRSACGSLWIDYARGRGLVGAEAEPRWGVLADVNPEIAETLVWSAEALRERSIWYTGSEAMMTRARFPMLHCPRV